MDQPRSERHAGPPPAPAGQKAAQEARRVRELREKLAGQLAARERTAADAQAELDRAAASKPGKPGKAEAAANAQAAIQFPLAVRRLLARLIDVLVIGVPAAAIAWGLFGNRIGYLFDGTFATPEPAVLLWLAVFVLVPLETLFIGMTGTSPGKYLLGLRVLDARGAPIGPARAWQRSLTILWRGMGLGLPPLTVVAIGVAGAQLMGQGKAPWDRALGLELRAAAIDNRRWQTALVAVVGGFFVLASGIWGELAWKVLQAAVE
jgi:uncharacterized RDD family membrane protein YckC